MHFILSERSEVYNKIGFLFPNLLLLYVQGTRIFTPYQVGDSVVCSVLRYQNVELRPQHQRGRGNKNDKLNFPLHLIKFAQPRKISVESSCSSMSVTTASESPGGGAAGPRPPVTRCVTTSCVQEIQSNPQPVCQVHKC